VDDANNSHLLLQQLQLALGQGDISLITKSELKTDRTYFTSKPYPLSALPSFTLNSYTHYPPFLSCFAASLEPYLPLEFFKKEFAL
jgi:hypothetical protein